MPSTQKQYIDFDNLDEHVSAIAEALDGNPAGSGYIVFCPAHDDRGTGKRSLKVEADHNTGKVLLHCKSGCDAYNVIEALREQGLWPQKLQSKSQRLWHSASDDTDKLLEYFRSRGITGLQELPKSLRQHSSLILSADADETYSGIVARISDADGNFISAYKIFLTDDFSKLADVPHPKSFMAGESPDGGHILIRPGTSGTIHVAEGIETALAIASRLPEPFKDDAVWAALTSDNLRDLKLPEALEELWIWCDKDKNNAGFKSAKVLANSAYHRKALAAIIEPHNPGKESTDWLDEIDYISEESLKSRDVFLPDEPWLQDGVVLESPWFMRNGGIWREKVGSTPEIMISRSAVWLRRCLDEFDSSYGVYEIAYIDSRNNQVKSVMVSRDIALDAAKSKAFFLKLANFPVSPDSYKLFVNYLFNSEESSNTQIHYTTGRTGWHKLPNNQLEFSPYSEKLSHTHAQDGISERISAIKPSGDAAEWVDVLIEAFEHGSNTAWPIAAALAAPLVRLLNIRSFIIDLFADNSTGKTLAAKMALSIYGDPATLMLSFDSTDAGLERNAHGLNDMLLVLDESQKVSTKSDVLKNWIYRLGNEQGREKGKGSEASTQTTLSWKNVSLLTGERSVKTYMGTQWDGIEGRTISVNRAPFDVDDTAWAQNLEASIYEHHGHLGPVWIELIRDNLEYVKRVNARNTRLLRLSTIQSEKVQNRKIPYYAVLLTAIDLLPEVIDIEYDLVAELWMTIYDHWVTSLKQKTYDNAAMSMLATVHSHYVENSFLFVHPTEEGKEGRFDISYKKLGGRVLQDGSIAFTLNTFRDALKRSGSFEPESAVEMFRRRDWLVQTDAEKKLGNGQHTVKIQDRTVRTYTLSAEAISLLHPDEDSATNATAVNNVASHNK